MSCLCAWYEYECKYEVGAKSVKSVQDGRAEQRREGGKRAALMYAQTRTRPYTASEGQNR